MTPDPDPFRWTMYFVVVLGILISVVLPILRGYLPKPKPFVQNQDDPPQWKIYVATGVFSLLTAVLIMAFARDTVKDWWWQDALLAGFAWDSLLQKVVHG